MSMEKSNQNERYALVLEGGGTKGAFHIGAARALQELGIDIGIVTGTSIGALNGAMVAQNKIEDAYQIWQEIKPSMILDVDDEKFNEISNVNFQNTELKTLVESAKKLIGQKGLGKSNMQELVSRHIDEVAVRNSDIEFGMVTVSLKDKKAVEVFTEDIPEGQLGSYVMASANYPLFQREEIQGEKFVDGGVLNNLPINMVIDKGYKKVIAVRTNEKGTLRGREKRYDDGIEITYVYPTENLGGVLNFDRENAIKNLKMGYYDTLKAMLNLKGNVYYIEATKNDEIFFEALSKIDEQEIEQLQTSLELNLYEPKRALFEFILPEMARLLKIEETYTYEDLVLALVEFMATNTSIERFEKYDFKTFFHKVDANYIQNETEMIAGLNKTEGIFKKIIERDLFNTKNREELLLQCYKALRKPLLEIVD